MFVNNLGDFNEGHDVTTKHDSNSPPSSNASQMHSAGVFDCSSDYWGTVFGKVPDASALMPHYMDSKEAFLFTGMYMFCASVRAGETKILKYEYDPGVYHAESPTCATRDSVVGLQADLRESTAEYVFWVNFNDWLQNVSDGYNGIFAEANKNGGNCPNAGK